MLHKIATPFKLVLVYILLLLFLAGGRHPANHLFDRRASQDDRSFYRLADDALGTILLDVCKIAAAALNWFTPEFSRRTGISVQMTADGEVAASMKRIAPMFFVWCKNL